jgi:hypothetical protein
MDDDDGAGKPAVAGAVLECVEDEVRVDDSRNVARYR